mgnify:CR=1 FL=1
MFVGIDVPEIKNLQVAYAAVTLSIIAPWWVTYATVYNMCYWFLESTEADWMTKTYLPALETSVEGI